MADKTDCFAYRGYACAALQKLDCEKCGFYKKKGTECDTCSYLNTYKCKGCRKSI